MVFCDAGGVLQNFAHTWQTLYQWLEAILISQKSYEVVFFVFKEKQNCMCCYWQQSNTGSWKMELNGFSVRYLFFHQKEMEGIVISGNVQDDSDKKMFFSLNMNDYENSQFHFLLIPILWQQVMNRCGASVAMASSGFDWRGFQIWILIRLLLELLITVFSEGFCFTGIDTWNIFVPEIKHAKFGMRIR